MWTKTKRKYKNYILLEAKELYAQVKRRVLAFLGFAHGENAAEVNKCIAKCADFDDKEAFEGFMESIFGKSLNQNYIEAALKDAFYIICKKAGTKPINFRLAGNDIQVICACALPLSKTISVFSLIDKAVATKINHEIENIRRHALWKNGFDDQKVNQAIERLDYCFWMSVDYCPTGSFKYGGISVSSSIERSEVTLLGSSTIKGLNGNLKIEAIQNALGCALQGLSEKELVHSFKSGERARNLNLLRRLCVAFTVVGAGICLPEIERLPETFSSVSTFIVTVYTEAAAFNFMYEPLLNLFLIIFGGCGIIANFIRYLKYRFSRYGGAKKAVQRITQAREKGLREIKWQETTK